MAAWHTVGGSLPGPTHKLNGTPNQDAYLAGQRNELTYLLVADGAGSCAKAREGANLALAVVKRELDKVHGTEHLESLVKDLFWSAKNALEMQVNHKDYGTTLTMLLIRGEEYGFGSVGDSFGVVEDSQGLRLLAQPQDKLYPNLTVLLTSEGATPFLVSGDGLSHAALSTDGLEGLTLENQEPVTGFWGNLFQRNVKRELVVKDLLEFLEEQDRLVDDTTLVMSSNLNREPATAAVEQ